jgi:hypothetical protein
MAEEEEIAMAIASLIPISGDVPQGELYGYDPGDPAKYYEAPPVAPEPYIDIREYCDGLSSVTGGRPWLLDPICDSASGGFR